jgi:hypothetical protein
MARRHVRFAVRSSVAAMMVGGFLSLTTVARAQVLGNQQLSVRLGIGGGYTAAPKYPFEGSGGDWNGEVFILLAPRGIPLELRPTFFSYGRGTGEQTVVFICPCALGGPCNCGSGYRSGSGPERATGGSLDVLVPLARGGFVPYLVGGLGVVGVTRQASSITTIHSDGVGYQFGAGARMSVGPVMLFGEMKYFATNASANEFFGHPVHMVPLTIGLAL